MWHRSVLLLVERKRFFFHPIGLVGSQHLEANVVTVLGFFENCRLSLN